MTNELMLLPGLSTETKVQIALEKMVDSVIMVEQLQNVVFYAKDSEYREYSLVTRTQTFDSYSGDVEDMVYIFNKWKDDSFDKLFEVYLEYEQFDDEEGVIMPLGNSINVGMMIKIEK